MCNKILLCCVRAHSTVSALSDAEATYRKELTHRWTVDSTISNGVETDGSALAKTNAAITKVLFTDQRKHLKEICCLANIR